MSDLSPLLRQKFFTTTGPLGPLTGGFLYSYQAGTTTPLATFTDNTGLTPCTNPIVLDANGEASFWIGPTPYKFVLTDSLGVVQWTIDNVLSLAAQIAAQINIAGSLAITANLSDVANKPTALVNLGIAPWLSRTSFAVLNNQAATNLTGETFDGTVYTTVEYCYEIVQGTTIMARGNFSVQYFNGTWTYVEGLGGGSAHGITFSLSQATTIGQLKAAESGLGNGTIKLKKHYFFV